MPDLLDAAESWLSGVLQDHVSQTIRYRSGGNSVELFSTTHEVPSAGIGADGIVRQWIGRGFEIPSASLVFNGNAHEPEAGDTIEQTIGAFLVTFSVLPDDDGKAFHYLDPQKRSILVMTKEQDRRLI